MSSGSQQIAEFEALVRALRHPPERGLCAEHDESGGNYHDFEFRGDWLMCRWCDTMSRPFKVDQD